MANFNTEQPRDFDFQIGNKQYLFSRGTLEKQFADFKPGNFRFDSVVNLRGHIIDSAQRDSSVNVYVPSLDEKIDLKTQWFRAGDGCDFIHDIDDRAKAVFGPTNRILEARLNVYELKFAGQKFCDLITSIGLSLTQVVDLDLVESERLFAYKSGEWGRVAIGTSEKDQGKIRGYGELLKEHPQTMVPILSAGFNPVQTDEQSTRFEVIMYDLKNRGIRETYVWFLLPESVKRKCSVGKGVGRLLAVNSYNSNGGLSGGHYSIGRDVALAIGVREIPSKTDAPKND